MMPSRSLVPSLSAYPELIVSQKVELAELVVDLESRNKYAIYAASGAPVAYAAEQGSGFLATVMRAFLRHWRSYEIHLFTADRRLVARAVHPFRFFAFNERLDVVDAQGAPLGAIQRRFALLSKKFDVIGADGSVLSVSSALWKPWSFELVANGQRQAIIEKKWSGMLKEMFTDADTFRLGFDNPGLSDSMRWLLIAAAVFVDLQFFEENQGTKYLSSGGSSDDE